MSKQFNSAMGRDGRMISPGGYTTKHVLLYTNAPGADGVIDITNLVTEIIVNEGIFKSSIEVELTIVDAINLLEDGRVSGSERIQILIDRTEPSGEYKSWDIETHIASIDSFARLKPGFETYVFRCVSRHSYVNQTKSISRSFAGSISKLISNIVTKDLSSELGIYNGNSKGSIRGIYPNLRPLDCITWLLRNASDNSTPFYFYESLNNGLELDSYESMVNQDVYREYNYLSTPDAGLLPGSQGYFEVLLNSIRKLSSDLDISQFHQLGDGAYGGTVNSLDYANKSYTSKTYTYGDNNTKLNKYKPFTSTAKINGQAYNEITKGKDYYLSTNSKAFKADSYHDIANPTILKKQAHYKGLGYMSHDIVVHGDFDMSPGKKISIAIDKAGDIEEGTFKRNQYFSGNYIVTEITHVFTSEEYTMDMAIRKDSLETDFDE